MTKLTDIYEFEVPPTIEMGSFKGRCRNNHNLTYQKDALWAYNSAREHDGLPPLSKMPKGTRYYKPISIGKNTDGTLNYIFKRIK